MFQSSAVVKEDEVNLMAARRLGEFSLGPQHGRGAA